LSWFDEDRPGQYQGGQILADTTATVFSGARVVSLVQGSHEWLEWRRGGLGGSDVPALMGHPSVKGKGPFSVWTSKMYGDEQAQDDDSAERGRYLEDGVARWVANRLGVELLGPVCLEALERPWVRASLDNHFFRPGLEWAGPSVLEIKTDRRWRDWENGPPQRVLDQVRWQMLVANAPDAEVGVYLPTADRFAHWTIERDYDAEADILRVAERFWNDHVVTGIPPVPDGSAECADWLSEKYAEYSPRSREASQQEAAILHALLGARQMAKWVSDNEKALANQAKAIIGPDEEIVWPGGRATWKADVSGRRRLRVLAEDGDE